MSKVPSEVAKLSGMISTYHSHVHITTDEYIAGFVGEKCGNLIVNLMEVYSGKQDMLEKSYAKLLDKVLQYQLKESTAALSTTRSIETATDLIESLYFIQDVWWKLCRPGTYSIDSNP